MLSVSSVTQEKKKNEIEASRENAPKNKHVADDVHRARPPNKYSGTILRQNDGIERKKKEKSLTFDVAEIELLY